MKDNTLREIDDILKHFYIVARPLTNGNISINGTTYAIDVPPEVALKDQLEALLAEEVRKARIEEVNRISRYVEIRNTADGATISAEYLYRQARKRIKQLEKEGK